MFMKKILALSTHGVDKSFICKFDQAINKSDRIFMHRRGKWDCVIFFQMTASKTRLITMSGIVLLLILTQVLYDPISSIKHRLIVSSIRSQLPQARATWVSTGITDYTFEITGDGRSICRPSAKIEVQKDLVVKVEIMEPTPQILPPDQWADPDWGNEVFLCNYNNFTITKIFGLLEQTLQNFPSSILQADFDTEYGFVNSFEYGIYVGYGLARPQIGNCCNTFRIQNFQPLTK